MPRPQDRSGGAERTAAAAEGSEGCYHRNRCKQDDQHVLDQRLSALTTESRTNA